MELSDLKLLNGITGKVGGLVFYQMNGKTIIRKRPQKLNKKQSPRQAYQRKAFALGQRFLTPIKEELNFTFQTQHGQLKKGIHEVLSQVLHSAISNHKGSPVLEPKEVLISRGQLDGVRNGNLEKLTEGNYRLTWDSRTWTGSPRDGDILYILLYCPSLKQAKAIRQGNYRKMESQEITIPWGINPESTTYCFGAFYSQIKNKLKFSDSTCFECL